MTKDKVSRRGLVTSTYSPPTVPRGVVLAAYQAALLALSRGDPVMAQSHVLRGLAEDPGHGDSYYLLGRLRKEAGDLSGALEAYADAARLSPDNPNVCISLGIALKAVGRLDEALLHLRRAVALQPQSNLAQLNLGNVLHALNNRGEAIVAYVQALGVNPRQPETHNNLGMLLREQGDYTRALAHFDAALKLNPRYATALLNSADTLFDRFDYAKAAVCYRGVLELDATLQNAALRLGMSLTELGEYVESETILRQVLAMQPDEPQALVCLGYVHFKREEYDQAEHCHHQALTLSPQLALAHWHLGSVLLHLGQVEKAAAAFEAAFALLPDEAELHMAFGTFLLLQNEFHRGWALYEARYNRGRRYHVALPNYHYPRWNDEALDGKHLLLVGEQGIGDEIMFASIIPEILVEARHCTITCMPIMERLLRRSFPTARVIPVPRKGTEASAAAEHFLEQDTPIDFWSPLASLGLRRRDRIEAFPEATPYLIADPARIELWRERLHNLGTGSYVGLSWRGGTGLTNTNKRSLPLIDLVRAIALPGRIFVSLQYTDCRAEIEQVERDTGIRVHHWQDAIDDYDQTAALVLALDRVVSVCTAVIHLGGALGQRVDVLAPFLPEWRYGLHNERMVWYADVYVHRQKHRNDWSEPLAAIARELNHTLITRSTVRADESVLLTDKYFDSTKHISGQR